MDKVARLVFTVVLPILIISGGGAQMAEWSYPWTDGTGDGGAYAHGDVDTFWEYVFGYTAATEGVLKGVLNALAVTGAATPIQIDTGAAIVKGKFYKNTAAVSKVIASPAGATRYDRVVLQSDWTTQTVRIAVLTGVEGAGVPPAVTQTDGTTWEITLATFSITTGGVITMTDARTYCHFSTEIGAGQIENRTRQFLLQAVGAYNSTDGIDLVASQPGWNMTDAKGTICTGWLRVPSDYVSGLTITPIVEALGAGNIYTVGSVRYGAVGESYNTHSDSKAGGVEAVVANQIKACTAITPANVAAGDYLHIIFNRDGTQVTDTLNQELYFKGWLVSYTADS